MKAFPFTALVTIVYLTLALAVARAADADQDELQGVWVATSTEQGT
jgi:hypothetical protein